MAYEEVINGLNLKDTELRLGLPGTEEEEQQQVEVSCVRSNKRQFHQTTDEHNLKEETSPPAKTQIVGWPPVRSNRKNNNNKNVSNVKVSMDGAPYLRKIDLKMYKNYPELLKALENMFKFTVGEYSEREDTKDLDLYRPMRTKMEIGCWWVMFHGTCSLHLAKNSES